MTVLVTGGRGNIGERVVSVLAAAGHRVRASARDAGALAVPSGVETVELDVADPRNAGAALKDVRAVFLYAAATLSGDLRGFLEEARAAGVEHLVLLSSPASYEAGEHDRIIGRAHRAAEEAVEEAGPPSTLLYPAWLAGNAQRDWAGQIKESGRVALPYPDAQVNPVHLDDVAEVAADLLTRDRHRARLQVVTGPESMRLRDIVDAVGDALGTPVPIDVPSREEAMARREEWMPAEVLDVLLDAEAAAVGVPAPVTNTVERITGHPARPFAEWVRAHREDFAA
ncbi:NAD(P)H-binding protein [Nocardiopsis sp. RSe5-2]|uniref:NAD(P)H-binding protein n=1 Tax=Nocardiopsis endophytica TaxID=3018445 RepID=A0ABT4UAX4_9ACTN|nr:NAD(P)H-binding protein [Nocardiopsis endophytica]MDA2813891.1 NAD(P)H-binding protein [Nocardiopsis endophytica]